MKKILRQNSGEMVNRIVNRMLRHARIAENVVRKAARGQQVRRKDKDLMRDTDGVSKGRDREPNFKPPRDDMKNRHREKRLDKDQRKDREQDDREVKKPVRRKSGVHPLDRIQKGAWEGLELPEDNYHRRVFNALWNIIESEKQISEKDFSGQRDIEAQCDEIVRSNEAEEIIARFEHMRCRPDYCAECIYDRMG